MEIKLPMEGKCQCGKVKYKILEPPILLCVCHCLDCQKLSTSAFGLSMTLLSSAFKLSGELKSWEYTSENGNHHIAYFCPGCGNRIYHEPKIPNGFIRLKPGTLDDTSILNPDIHLWVKRKQPWVLIPEGIPVHDTQPEDPRELFRLVEQSRIK